MWIVRFSLGRESCKGMCRCNVFRFLREGGVTKYYGKTLSAVENFFAVDSNWLHRHKVRLQRGCMYISG